MNGSTWYSDRSSQRLGGGIHEVEQISALSTKVDNVAIMVQKLSQITLQNQNVSYVSTPSTPIRQVLICDLCGGGHNLGECLNEDTNSQSSVEHIDLVGYNRPQQSFQPQGAYNPNTSRNHPVFLGATQWGRQIPNILMLENQIANQASTSSTKVTGKLPACPENPREHVNAIVTRSGKKLEEPPLPADKLTKAKFTIPCVIGGSTINRSLCDLGASVNVMPLSLCKKLNLGEPQPVEFTLQFADRSTKNPIGILEDVPVRVDKYFVPCDFVVMDIREDPYTPIILGRPFLATTGEIIDARKGSMIVDFGEEKVAFNVLEDPNSRVVEKCYRDDVMGSKTHGEDVEKVEKGRLLGLKTCDRNFNEASYGGSLTDQPE
nr:uncharacterized protein LOC109166929 [Ipomoea batatas]